MDTSADANANANASDNANARAEGASSAARVRAAPVSSFEEFSRLAAPLRCARAIRCGWWHASGLDACVAAGDAEALRLLGVTRGLAAGRYRYESEIAGACLEALERAPCRPDLSNYPNNCLSGAVPAPLLPALPPGAPCERWEECAGGLCTGELGAVGACVGFTTEVGGRCDHNTLCGEGLFCEGERCKARGAVGEPCSGHWQACHEGLICAGYRAAIKDPHYHSPATPGVCARPRGLGAACRRAGISDDCQRPLYCDFGAATPVCAAPAGVGARCGWIDACADGLRCDGITLGPAAATNGSGMREVLRAGVCAPHGDLDAPCEADAYDRGCPTSLRCEPTQGRCVARGEVGAPCEVKEDCVGYGYCDGSKRKKKTCQRQRAHGEACEPVRGERELDGPCFIGRCDPKRRVCVRGG